LHGPNLLVVWNSEITFNPSLWHVDVSKGIFFSYLVPQALTTILLVSFMIVSPIEKVARHADA
jgi:hypothetical protein